MTESGTPTQPVVEGATRAQPARMKDPVAAASTAAAMSTGPEHLLAHGLSSSTRAALIQ